MSGIRIGREPWRIVPSIALRYLLPYYLILLAYSAAAGFDRPSLLLVSNFFRVNGPVGEMHSFWFMEEMFQAALFVAACFSIPALRTAFARAPGVAGTISTALAVIPPLAIAPLRATHVIPAHSPDMVLYLVLGGITLAATKQLAPRLFVSLLLLGTAWLVQGALGLSVVVILATGLILVLIPRIAMPAPMAFIVRQIGRSAIYIYLLSVFSGHIVPTLLRLAHVRVTPSLLGASFLTVLLVGIAADLLVSWLARGLGSSWRVLLRRRQSPSPAYAE
jgi:hypothetical protein